MANQYYKTYLEGTDDDIDFEKVEELMQKYESFYQKLIDHKIENAHLIKPLINGKEIMDLYKVKGGKFMRTITDKVFEWQLANPDGTHEEITKYLLDNKDEFTA
jgi:tRNA nucleotidyltransferase (CCA-adding enzyme)